jgi:hypothetical protein
MLRLLAFAGLAFFVTSCADLNRANNTGGSGGSGGSGGMDGTGGSGGVGGSDGTGGTAGGGVVLERVLIADPESFAAEANDIVDSDDGSVAGQVFGACPAQECVGSDPVDQFRLTPLESGDHRIYLDFQSSVGSDLDLYLTNSEGSPLAQSATPGSVPETIISDLSTGQSYIIQVQAFDTKDALQPYTLEVTQLP